MSLRDLSDRHPHTTQSKSLALTTFLFFSPGTGAERGQSPYTVSDLQSVWEVASRNHETDLTEGLDTISLYHTALRDIAFLTEPRVE